MMIDADKLPIRTVTIKRRMLTGGKPYYVSRRVRVVLESELELEKARKPRSRMERIQRMNQEEMARFLWGLADGENQIGFCQEKAECREALDVPAPEAITEENCLKCMAAWLMAEV